MALDATVGGATANSYNTRVEFVAYLTERLWVPAVVTASTDLQKDAALMWATMLFDAEICIIGTATYPTQALTFPRSGLLDRNGAALSATTIPAILKYAINELARLLLVSDRTLENEVSAAGLKSLKAGPVSLAFKDDIEINIVPASIKGLLPKSWLCATDEEAASEPLLEVL